MHVKTKKYLRESLKGIWSPFFRCRIRKEILDHIYDMMVEEGLSEEMAVARLGEAIESNLMYKSIMYKKLRSDFLFYGSLSCIVFVLSIFSIHNQIEKYNNWKIGQYKKIEKKFKDEALSLNYFKRSHESQNASIFINSLFDKNNKLIREDFLNELNRFDYWDSSELFSTSLNSSSKIIHLSKIAKKQLEKSENNDQMKRDYLKVAELIYSTETMIGYRVANNMIDWLNSKESERANRVSGTAWGLLNLMPQIIEFEKSFANEDFYKIGLCHHAHDFWYSDNLYSEFMKASFPLEKDWAEELIAFNKIKTKMKKDCRLSFLKVTTAPEPLTAKTLWVNGPTENSSLGIYESLMVQALRVPYLRNLAGRYLIYRASISIQGGGEKFYAQK